jgi:hypothetical protein
VVNFLNMPSIQKSLASETIPLEEDFDIIGFQPLLPTQKVLILAQGPVFSGLPVPTRLSPADSTDFRIQVQEKCADRFGKTVAAEKLIFYREETGCYSLQSDVEDESKIRERRERGMKMMAQARLMDNVVSLENDLYSMKGLKTEHGRSVETTKILILDTSSFLFHLNRINSIMAAEKNLLVVPLYGSILAGIYNLSLLLFDSFLFFLLLLLF